MTTCDPNAVNNDDAIESVYAYTRGLGSANIPDQSGTTFGNSAGTVTSTVSGTDMQTDMTVSLTGTLQFSGGNITSMQFNYSMQILSLVVTGTVAINGEVFDISN